MLYDWKKQLNREEKEAKNLFSDPKFARNAWRGVGMAILQNPANKPIPQLDKDGNETSNSLVESYTYQSLVRDLKEINKENREPTELEMIMACQIRKARTDTGAAIFVRDTVGAKPIDESKIEGTVTNVFENLTDEELLFLKARREEVQQRKDEVQTIKEQDNQPCKESIDE